MTRSWRRSSLIASLALVLVAGEIATAWTQSDPLCPRIVACEYEAPAFTIRVVDQQTGKPLADVHAIASWVMYGGNRRGILMALEAVSGPDGQLVFPSWGPIRSAVEGLVGGRDPVISTFRPGYAARLIYNATPLDQPDTARVHSFQQPGKDFELVHIVLTTPTEAVKDLWKAAEPLDGGEVSRHDPESIRRVYVNRWKRIRIEAGKLPEVPEVQRLRWQLDTTIRIFSGEGGQ